MGDALRETPLVGWHESAGAKMVPFAGWRMPVQYPNGSLAEHRLTRRSVGLFDVSHMGRLRFTGAGSTEALERLLTCHVAQIAVGGSGYALMCRSDGTTIDDVFAYHDEDSWLVVVNAANHLRDVEWISGNLGDRADVTDITDELAMIAIQGPNAIALVDALAAGSVESIPRFAFVHDRLAGQEAMVSRTGYTGEDGVEIYIASPHARSLWETLLAEADQAGIEAGACGLAARDSLRFEPGFALYGHELDDSTTPLEARLNWACDFDTDFIGREALLEQKERGVERRLATVTLLDSGVPRQGYGVHADHDGEPSGQPVGTVASGMFAPTVDAYCANVFVPRDLARTGTILHIDIRGRMRRAKVVKRPLYKPAYRS